MDQFLSEQEVQPVAVSLHPESLTPEELASVDTALQTYKKTLGAMDDEKRSDHHTALRTILSHKRKILPYLKEKLLDGTDTTRDEYGYEYSKFLCALAEKEDINEAIHLLTSDKVIDSNARNTMHNALQVTRRLIATIRREDPYHHMLHDYANQLRAVSGLWNHSNEFAETIAATGDIIARDYIDDPHNKFTEKMRIRLHSIYNDPSHLPGITKRTDEWEEDLAAVQRGELTYSPEIRVDEEEWIPASLRGEGMFVDDVPLGRYDAYDEDSAEVIQLRGMKHAIEAALKAFEQKFPIPSNSRALISLHLYNALRENPNALLDGEPESLDEIMGIIDQEKSVRSGNAPWINVNCTFPKDFFPLGRYGETADYSSLKSMLVKYGIMVSDKNATERMLRLPASRSIDLQFAYITELRNAGLLPTDREIGSMDLSLTFLRNQQDRFMGEPDHHAGYALRNLYHHATHPGIEKITKETDSLHYVDHIQHERQQDNPTSYAFSFDPQPILSADDIDIVTNLHEVSALLVNRDDHIRNKLVNDIFNLRRYYGVDDIDPSSLTILQHKTAHEGWERRRKEITLAKDAPDMEETSNLTKDARDLLWYYASALRKLRNAEFDEHVYSITGD